jgi:hypothetical protein
VTDVRLLLDPDDGGEDDHRVSGCLAGDDGRAVRFEGWLELARVLEERTRSQRQQHHEGAT